MRAKPWDVSDGLSERIEPLLPTKPRRFRYPGRRPFDDRLALQGSQAGHARAHWHETSHPVIRAKVSIGSGFIWCYPDNRYVRERKDAAA